MITNSPVSGIRLVTETEFPEAVAAYAAEGARIPLVGGQELLSHVSGIPCGSWWLPQRPETHQVGYVPGDEFEPLAHLIATHGGRPAVKVDDLHELDAPEDDGSLTVVVAPTRLRPAVLASAAHRNARLSFFTARDLAAACRLLLRTLTCTADYGDRQFDSVAHQDTSVQAATELTGAVHVLAGRSHGRECLLHFDRSVLCGRARGPADLELSGAGILGRTSCQQGHGCFRRDVSERRRLRGDDIQANVVFIDGCRVNNPVGRFGPGVALVLSLLDGRAVAVIAPPGNRFALRGGAALFTALIRSGMPIAEATQLYNRITARTGSSGCVALGDGAREWNADGSVARYSLTDASTTIELAEPTTAVVVEKPRQSRLFAAIDGTPLPVLDNGRTAWAAVRGGSAVCGELNLMVVPDVATDWLRNVYRPTVAGLTELAHAGLDADLTSLPGWIAQARTIAERAEAAVGPGDLGDVASLVKNLEGAVARTQHSAVEALVAHTASTWASPISYWPEPVRFGATDLLCCAYCGERAWMDVETSLGLAMSPPTLFGRCNNCYAGRIGPRRDIISLDFDMPSVTTPGHKFAITIRLEPCVPLPILASVGVAAAAERMVGTRLATTFDASFENDDLKAITVVGEHVPEAPPDVVTVYVFVIANGAFTIFQRDLWICAPENSHEGAYDDRS